MLLNCDARQLEWVCAMYWAQDPIGMQEIINGIDIHGDNQARFKLPSRLAAKTLCFKIIYGGSGYGFATDPHTGLIGNEKFWNDKIEQFYQKYKSLHAWHKQLYERVTLANGKLDLPTGRSYQFSPEIRRGAGSRGEVSYPRTKILNYPVQGLAADLMSIARVSLHKRLKAMDLAIGEGPMSMNFNGILWVNTVHDSIVLDIKPELWYTISPELVNVIEQVFLDIPNNVKRLFEIEFNLPVRCEITYGKNWKEMKEYNADRASS